MAPAQLLSYVQARLEEGSLDYYWVPSSDEYLNEYVPEHLRRLREVSGFTGSAGDVLVAPSSARIFVDGRYHVQVDQEVDAERFDVHKVGAPGVVALRPFLESEARRHEALRVGVDPRVVSHRGFRALEALLAGHGGELVALDDNLVDAGWSARPAPLRGPIVEVGCGEGGAEPQERLAKVRSALGALGADATVLTRLDQVAWLLNRRGSDIAYNPVFEAVLVLLPKRLVLFVDAARWSCFAGLAGLETRPLESFAEELVELARAHRGRFLVDPSLSSHGVTTLLRRAEARCVHGLDPVESLKSLKGSEELEAMGRAGRQASRAKVKALCWLEGELAAERRVTERGFAEHLEATYAAEPGYHGLSFQSISAAGANAAIVHYGSPSDSVALARGGLFMIDSGAHIGGGTTDATRTVLCGGQPSDEQRRCYSVVLAGHAACAGLRFPVTVTGGQLDAITRAPLWRHGLDYIHGTGHGVGAWLNVHEGPVSIGLPDRGAATQRRLEPGQVLSIEPGVYREGWGGVRLENLYQVCDDGEDDLGRARRRFAPLTWVPFDRRLIDPALLGSEGLAFVDGYHRGVRAALDALGGFSVAETAWLDAQCRPLASLGA
jgi:Xaa-Pro aminopeptidase